MTRAKSPPKPPRIPEKVIQKQIEEAFALIPGLWFERSNTGAGRGGKVRYGVTGGADIRCMINGLSFAIEVKSPGERLAEDQDKWAVHYTSCGGWYFVASSADEAIDQVVAMRSLGLPNPPGLSSSRYRLFELTPCLCGRGRGVASCGDSCEPQKTAKRVRGFR